MTQPGIGAMIHQLAGGSRHNPSEYYGRVISAAVLADDKLTIKFADGISIVISDNGQSCCESRYMRTDDDLTSLAGQSLVRIETKAAPDEKEGEYGEVHEIVFLEIGGDRSFVTFSFHNEHNGYYGGFGLNIDEQTAP